MDPSSTHSGDSPGPHAGWPGPLFERTGSILRRLTSSTSPDEVAIQRSVRDLAGLPGVVDARLVRTVTDDLDDLGDPDDPDGSRTMTVAVGEDHRLRLSGPVAGQPAVAQAVRLVAVAIENRLPGRDDRPSAGRAADRDNLREARDLLRIESARLRTLINSIPLAILVVDEQLRIAEVNKAALGLMGVTDPATTMVGVLLTELAVQAQPETRRVVEIAIDFAHRSIDGGLPVHREEVRLPGDVMVEASYLPVDLDGRVRGHLLMGQDVTGRVRAQQVLETRNRELAELGALKNEFLVTVSHELRTPLTALSSLVEVLAAHEHDEVARAEVIGALRRNTDRLAVIVEYLLVLARLEANQLPLADAPVDTRTLVIQRAEEVRRTAGPREVRVLAEVEEGTPAEVRGDPGWLTRMVHYVVSGAVATCAPGATVVLHSEVDAHHWVLTVTGADLPTRSTGHVFAAIVAGHDRSSRHSPGSDRIGVGLGLTLAEAIAKRHGGDLFIDHENGGSCIRITLPVR